MQSESQAKLYFAPSMENRTNWLRAVSYEEMTTMTSTGPLRTKPLWMRLLPDEAASPMRLLPRRGHSGLGLSPDEATLDEAAPWTRLLPTMKRQ